MSANSSDGTDLSSGASSSLRVTVEPGQSSFFAGEYFFCKITFTNVAQPKGKAAGRYDQQQQLPGSAPAASTSFETNQIHAQEEQLSTPTGAPSVQGGSAGSSRRPSQDTTDGSSINSASHSRRKSWMSNTPGHSRQPSGSNSRSYVADASVGPPSSPRTSGANTPADGRKVSHGKSQSLANIRVPGTPTSKGSVGDLSTANASTSQRGRKGLIGRGETKLQHAPPTSSTPAIGVSAPGAAPPASSEHASADRTGESIHGLGLGLGLPGSKQLGTEGYPASRNASGVSAAASAEDDVSIGENGQKHKHRQKVLETSKQIMGKVKGLSVGRPHPHSRRKSVIQTQAEDLTEAFALEMGMTAEDDEETEVGTMEGSNREGTATDDQSSSAKSIADEVESQDGNTSMTSSTAVNESTTSFGTDGKGTDTGFYGIGRNDTMESVVREDLSERLAAAPARRAGGRVRANPLDLARRESISSNRSMLSPTNVATNGAPNFPAHLRRQASISSGAGISDLASPSVTSAGTNGPSASPLFPIPAQENVAEGTEVLLWSFAQFSGTFSIDESMIKPFDFELVKHRIAQGTLTSGGASAAGSVASPGGRSELQMQAAGGRHGRTRTIGGGELLSVMQASKGQEQPEPELRLGTSSGSHVGDDAPETEEAMRRALGTRGSDEDGWRAYLKNRLTIGGGGGTESGFMGGVIRRQKHKRTGSTLVDTTQKTLLSKSIPTFSTPPSILCVDLSLEPGQSRSYTFKLPLPPDLPPSYLGKSISFTYTLAIGTNRLDFGPTNTPRSNGRRATQKSRLIQIPIRVYNHVSMTGARPFWDLLNPVIWVRDGAAVANAETENDDDAPVEPRPRANSSTPDVNKKARDDSSHASLVAYARELLASSTSPLPASDSKDSKFGAADGVADSTQSTSLIKGNNSLDTSYRVPVSESAPRKGMLRRRSSAMSNGSRGYEEDMIDTCMEAVEVLSRTSPKVSYDIAKDGQIAAVLTLVKSKFRLGDTVSGVVTINQKGAYARIVRLAVHLESHEEIQSDVATLPSARTQKATKRVISSHHESTLDAGQVSFSLPIPSGATPDFNTSGVKLVWTIRLSLLTLTSIQARPKKANAGEGEVPLPRVPHRKLPPPHLVPGTPDGYPLYHQSLRALPSLCGPLPSFTPDESHRTFLERNGYGTEAKLEIVECAVPLTVLPNSTKFKTASVRFAA